MSGCVWIISEGGDPKNSLASPLQFGVCTARSTSHPLAQAASVGIKFWPYCQPLGSIISSSQMDLGLLITALWVCCSGRFSTQLTVNFFKLYSTSLPVRILWETLLKASVVSKQAAVPPFTGPIVSKMRCVRCGLPSVAYAGHFPSPFSSSSICRWVPGGFAP